MEVWWFSRVVAHHPYAILAAVFVFSTTCLIVPFATKKFPDFSDPQLGFEARGTVLAQRLTAWQNLIDATQSRGELVDNPLEYYNYLQSLARRNGTNSRRRGEKTSKNGEEKKKKKKKAEHEKVRKNGEERKKAEYERDWNDTRKESSDKDNLWWQIKNLDPKNAAEREHGDREHVDDDGFFCNEPNAAYARVVLASDDDDDDDDQDLWSLEGVLAQCHIDAALRANEQFPALCQTRSLREGADRQCCRSWSPANYVALLSNRSSCLGVTEGDLGRVRLLLRRCSPFYRNFELTPNCAEDANCQKRVPVECLAHNAAYHLLHYLLDIEFASDDNKSNATLRSAMLFLPIAASSATLDFYRGLSNGGLSYGKFRVTGMQLGLKSTLFDRLLVSDSRLVLAGFAFVTVCIWGYTGSILLTVTTILAVLFSLGISYALYTLVLRITFFPFMNLLAIVVAVGIGADDAFIFCKVWECGKQQKLTNGGLVRLVQETMKHAVPSMFVTSLTTAVAFFASIVSNVTAINCFSLFSGMTVIANFFLMVTWLPASVVISEHCRLSFLSPASFVARKIIRPLRIFADRTATGFGKVLTRVAIDLRWLWLTGLGGIAVIGCMVVFRYPGLQLPDSPDFQLFDGSHPFERYDLVYARRFWFEKLETGDGGEVLPLRFVWGVKPVDNGDYLDPGARGALEWDDTFDVSNPKSQLWLQQFCRGLRGQSFYRSTLGPLLPNCFVESLRTWMQTRCEDPIDSRIDRAPCCERNPFPYAPAVLRQCAAAYNAEMYKTPSYLWTREGGFTAGLKFLKESLPAPTNGSKSVTSFPLPTIKALVVEYDSTYAYSLSFVEMDRFYNQVESWMQEQLSSAPLGMRGGWFVSRLDFYELQRTLYEGTMWAMGVSMALALTVLALVTLNPLVSLYAITAIGAAIVVTVAALVLLGWKLNVLESVAVSTAIGLAVDFSLHYGVSYRACNSDNRIDRVKFALEQMGGPTLMAAATSGAAGALMLPSHVLAYIQIGVFLLLVMAVSWLYATLFLCSLLAVIGPSPHFAQFQYPRLRTFLFGFRKGATEGATEVDRGKHRNRRRGKGRGMLSESTLSTSSTVCQFHCGELESLAARPPVSPSLPPSPSATLLHLDPGQSATRNSRRKQAADLD